MKKLALLFFACFCALFLPVLSYGQLTVTSRCTPVCQFFDGSGNILAGGKIFFYAAGTSTPQATYTDNTGTVQNQNLVILNASGMPPNGIFLTANSYKIVGQNASSVQQWSQDGYKNASSQLSTTVSGTFTVNGQITQGQPTASTAGANESSFLEQHVGTYWTGAASANDIWSWQNVLGTGANPTSIFTLSHSGSSGATTLDVTAAATLKTSVVNAGTNSLTAGAGTFSSLDNLLWVDGNVNTTCAAAITAAGSNQRTIVLPSTYAGANCTGIPANVAILDLRGNATNWPLNTSQPGGHVISFNGNQESAVQGLGVNSNFTSPTVTAQAITATVQFTGTMPSNQTLSGVVGEADTFGAITTPGGVSTGTLTSLEGFTTIQSTGGTLPLTYAVTASVNMNKASSTTNVTTATDYNADPVTNVSSTGTFTNAYGYLAQVQTKGTARNYGAMLGQGSGATNNGNLILQYNSGVNIDSEDSGGTPRKMVGQDTSANVWLQMIGSGAIQFRANDTTNRATLSSASVFNLPQTAGVFSIAGDTGISRGSANVWDVGSGAQGSTAGFIKTTQTLQVTGSNFTTTATTLSGAGVITGLNFTAPASAASNWSFRCDLIYSQATAAAADLFGIITAGTAPTNLEAVAEVLTTNTGTQTDGSGDITSATSTTIVSATPSAAGAIGTLADMFIFHIWGTLEAPSNASPTQVGIAVATGNAADALTIYRGSACWWY